MALWTQLGNFGANNNYLDNWLQHVKTTGNDHRTVKIDVETALNNIKTA